MDKEKQKEMLKLMYRQFYKDSKGMRIELAHLKAIKDPTPEDLEHLAIVERHLNEVEIVFKNLIRLLTTNMFMIDYHLYHDFTETSKFIDTMETDFDTDKDSSKELADDDCIWEN